MTYNPLAIPTEFNARLASLLCESVAGGLSLAAACRRPGFPPAATVYQWRKEVMEFAEALELASAIKADLLVEQAQDIADDASQDYKDVTRRDGRVERVLDAEHVNRSKLRVHIRQWAATRLSRKAWGDAKQIDIDATLSVQNLTDEEIDRRLLAANARLIEIEG